MEVGDAASARGGGAPAVPRAAAAGQTPSFLYTLSSGRFSALSAAAAADKLSSAKEDEDVDMDAEETEAAPGAAAPAVQRFLPLLTRLQHARRSYLAGRTRRRSQATTADAAIDALLLAYDEVNTLRAYAGAFDRLELADIERVGEDLRLENQQQVPSLPLYRRFENATPEQRACLVLHAVHAFASAASPAALAAIKTANRAEELFLNEIYRAELSAVLVLALASLKLQKPMGTQQSPFRRAVVVEFCLTLPIGAELIASLVENDPASSEQVLDTIARAMAQLTQGKSMAQQEREALALATELPAEVVAIQDAAVALTKISPFHAAMTRNKLRAVESLWAVAVVLHLHTASSSASAVPSASLSSLRDDATVFLLDWMRAPASPLLAFFRIAANRRSGEDKTGSSPPPFEQVAEHLLELVKDQLLDDLEAASTPTTDSTSVPLSPVSVSATLGVWISLLSLGNFRLTDHESMRLLRCLDRLAKLPAPRRSSRGVSLSFVIVLLVCYPLAPVLSKIPSQRDESTKAVASLAQHCVVSLYNASAAARPLLIVSAVLLYTKSPALLSLLASVVGGPNAFLAAVQAISSSAVPSIRAEYLHVVGDVVLKQVLTENLMARDILMDDPPLNVSANDRDQLRDMPLRAIHGLLCEKSFLRFHHGRRLEAWLARLIGGADQSYHSKGTEHDARVALPVHPLLLSVLLEWIDNYVMAFEYPIAQTPTLHLSIVPLRPALVYRWLSAPCLHAPFLPDLSTSEEQTTWARALLALTYALQFNQRLRHAMEVPGSKLSMVSASMNRSDGASATAVITGGDIVFRYDLDEFPLRNILLQAMAASGVGQTFEFISPTLHRLMMDEFPGRVPLPEFDGQLAEQDVESAWFQSRDNAISYANGSGGDSRVSLALATLKVAELRDAPVHVVRHAQAFCRVVNELFAKRLRHRGSNGWSSDPEVIVRIVHALCYPDWTAKQFAQQRQLLHYGRVASVPLVTTYRQLLESPFRVVQDAERVVFCSPPLLELLLLLVRDIRHASNAQLTRCDPTVGFARVSASLQQQQTAQQLPDAMTARSTSVQQHTLVQDCLLTHALLRELAEMMPSPSADGEQLAEVEPATAEAILLVCATVDDMFAEDAAGTGASLSSPQQPSPPRLLMAVHTQGYDPRVISSLVEHVPSLRLLWTFWMQSTSSSARSSSSGNGGGSNSSNATSKPLMDFLVGDGGSLDKNAPRAGFRLSLFFSLCAKYMSVREYAVVAPAMKAVWNKLRVALTASTNAVAAQSASSIKTGSSAPFVRVDGAFLLTVLPLAARACARHPELSAELVQFLFKLQKLLPSSSTAGSIDSTLGSERRLGSTSSTLERALHDAYRTLLQRMGS